MQKCLFRIIQSLETMCKKTFDYHKTFRVKHAAGNEGNSHLSGTCLQNERTELSGKQFMSTGSKMDSICSDCLKSLFDSSPVQSIMQWQKWQAVFYGKLLNLVGHCTDIRNPCLIFCRFREDERFHKNDLSGIGCEQMQ